MPRETTDEKLGLTGNRSKTRLQSLSSWFAFSHCLPGTLHEIHDRPTDRQTDIFGDNRPISIYLKKISLTQ